MNTALTPDTLPPGKVGVPYSATLTLSGGAPPNFFLPHPNWDLPPGLTLDQNTGVLSGTPTAPGNFPMIVYAIATGGGDQEMFKLYRLAIDNAAGEAPAVSLSPTPIQVLPHNRLAQSGTDSGCGERHQRRLPLHARAARAFPRMNGEPLV